ncbi:MAG: response regulator, partial [Flavobacterium sp.]
MEKIKILIVEDEMIIGANIALQLTTLGYDVLGYIPRAEEALIQIRQTKPDILLLDINLKGNIDGIELAQLILNEIKIPIIYLTANADEAHFNRAKTTNPYAFISKPFKKLDLQHAIELALHRIKEEKKIEDNDLESFVMSDSIFIRNHDKMIKILIKDILYIEAERNYCKIHCKD